jgi:DNA-binding transcriptional MocR family regulator
MIDRLSGVPVHRQVYDDLRGRIAAGEWAPGAFLPSEVDLAHEYGIGHGTLRKVYAQLRSEGIIRGGGPGMRASVPPQAKREKVVLPGRYVLTARMPTAVERVELGIPEGVPVIEVRWDGTVRVFRADQHEFRPN